MNLCRFTVQTGPFSFSINSNISYLVQELGKMYEGFSECTPNQFIDFNISIQHSKGLRRIIKPQANFFLDEFSPFKPLPAIQAYPMLEWGMNWCMAQHAHHYLMLHAGVVEKNGKAIVLPATSGSGKSTLTAALVFNGWRLFSDEIALFSLKDELLYPCSRPINLKNESIEIIKNYIPDAVFSNIALDTHKGTVSLLKPPADSVRRMHEPAPLGMYVFPTYKAGSAARLNTISPEQALRNLTQHSFNYHIIGKSGFELLVKQLQTTPCYEFQYSSFDDAIDVFNGLVD
ncbi:HprK-related kinase A [Catenovulum maritimum]|uniref:Serine kinase n=1 Tax=Catenovulum maritimum TaxID=1513271 RepID=A0A0J8GPC0_9ALTE|nr:HprK-related kinase A [Catenovulum maritimum]KMT64622.1 serine kinase [Catenovulum maritimum]